MAAAGEDVAAGPDEECGVRFRWLAESLQPPYRDHFPGYTDGMSRGEPGGFFVTPAVGENAAAIRRFQLRADDTWIVTFPKSGTTWTQEMLWMIVNDHDYQAAQRQILDTRSPFLESVVLVVSLFVLGKMICKQKKTIQVPVPAAQRADGAAAARDGARRRLRLAGVGHDVDAGRHRWAALAAAHQEPPAALPLESQTARHVQSKPYESTLKDAFKIEDPFAGCRL